MTYSIDIFNKDGKKVNTFDLDASIFHDGAVNESAINEYVRLQMANARVAIANTKTRGQVQGSGKKIYRQKGTGSGRAGEKRSPLRKKGGIVFGPSSQRNYTLTMPKKMKRKALAGLFTKKVQGGNVMGLDMFDYADIKTKNAKKTLENLSLNGQKTLVVIPENDQTVKKSFGNLPNVKVLLAGYMNPRELLNHTKVLLIKDSLDIIQKNLSI